MQSTQNNDLLEDFLQIVDQSIENTGEKHARITSDCGFCDLIDFLQKVKDDRDGGYT